MSSLNHVPAPEILLTEGGAVAAKITPLQELRRSVMGCMLWEDIAYENGISVAARIKDLVHAVSMQDAAQVAIEAREQMKLRHVPLLVVREMARHPRLKSTPHLISETLTRVIQRPDEITEFLAIYWKDGKTPISKQAKIGLGNAFSKFNEYSLAKFNRDGAVKLRDVMFLSHAKPSGLNSGLYWDKNARRLAKNQSKDPKALTALINAVRPQGFSEKEVLFQKITDRTLETPDTWETELSAGKNKAETFRRLMAEDKLFDMAFLKNLRGMLAAGITTPELAAYGEKLKWSRVLPFRFISAARAAPGIEPVLEKWMMKCLEGMKKLKGSTLLIVDTSGSMGSMMSGKSDLKRIDAAAAVATLAREVCEDPTIYVTAGDDYKRIHATKLIPARKGFALIDYISGRDVQNDIGGGGIFLTQCLDFIDKEQKGRKFDRVMVFTDEQDCDQTKLPKDAKLLGKENYMINISSNKRGIGYKKWTHIDGFSEAVIDFIQANEAQQQ